MKPDTGADPGLSAYKRRIERVIVAFRAAVLMALLLTAFLLDILKWNGVALSLVGLAISILVGLVLAARGDRHWALTLISATVEILLLQAYLFASAQALGLPLDIALSSPGAWLVFIYLVIGVLRLQAALVAYNGLLFSLCWTILTALAPDTHRATDIAHAAGHLAQVGQISDVVRIGIILVSTGALAFATWHSRRSLVKAIYESTARKHLSTHFPRAILERLLDGKGNEPQLGYTDAAIAFVDLHGFTTIAENATGSEIGELLSDFRSHIHDVVGRYDGVIDKFMGDGALIVFGVPESRPDDAVRALSCIMDLRDTLGGWMAGRSFRSSPKLSIGIGLHFGRVLAGVIGSAERVEFTVLGDTVNVAARLQQLANDGGGGTLVSEDALVAAGFRVQDYGQGICTIPLRGRRRSLRAIKLAEARLEPISQGTAA
jgi:adenylate cyclase